MEMKWHELFPKEKRPTMEDIADYTGEAKDLWLSLASHFESAYKAAPKLTYSGCGMKPGWNVKYQKSGKAFGTLYPQENAFDVMIIIGYNLETEMTNALPLLSEQTACLYQTAGDYMKIGKWMMLRIDNQQILEDYKRIVAVKYLSR